MERDRSHAFPHQITTTTNGLLDDESGAAIYLSETDGTAWYV